MIEKVILVNPVHRGTASSADLVATLSGDAAATLKVPQQVLSSMFLEREPSWKHPVREVAQDTPHPLEERLRIAYLIDVLQLSASKTAGKTFVVKPPVQEEHAKDFGRPNILALFDYAPRSRRLPFLQPTDKLDLAVEKTERNVRLIEFPWIVGLDVVVAPVDDILALDMLLVLSLPVLFR